MRPRVPGGLARRIDRLAVHAHAFHRFAHHPLCRAYASELVSLGGRTRVCRGCLLAGLGASLGVAVALARPGLLASSLGLALGVLGLFVAERSRLPKMLSRFTPAVLVVGAMGGGVEPALAALGVVAVAVVAYRRRGPHRGPCERCPDRSQVPCPGFAPMVRRERAFERLAGRWLTVRPRSNS